MAGKLRIYQCSALVDFFVFWLISQRSTFASAQVLDVPANSPSPFPDGSLPSPTPTPVPRTARSPDTPEVDVLPPSDDFSPPSPSASAATPADSESAESPPAPPAGAEGSSSEGLSPVESDIPSGRHGLTGGAKAGIAFGVILGIFFACGSVYIYRTRQENVKRSQLAHMHPMRI